MEWIEAKKLLGHNKNPNAWFGIDYTLNLYRGCSHGCIYCDSISECYHIDDFDRVRAKKDATYKLHGELLSKRKKGIVGMGAMSEPYNPFETKEELTRDALQLFASTGFGTVLATKSSRVARDIDCFKDIQAHSPVLVQVTLTTTNDELAKKIEPYVSSPTERLQALYELSKAGIPTCVLLMPVLPFITDNEANIINIVESAKEAGVPYIYPMFGMTLRDRQRDYYYQKLNELSPNLVSKYQNKYGENYNCQSSSYRNLNTVFQKKCKETGIVNSMSKIIEGYTSPYAIEQLSLF